MSTATAETSKRTAVADATAKGAGVALRRLGRGLRDAPGALQYWVGAHFMDDAILEAAAGDPRTKAIDLQKRIRQDRRAVLATVVIGLAGWLSGGWWPLLLVDACLAVALSWLVWRKTAAVAWAGRAWGVLAVTVTAWLLRTSVGVPWALADVLTLAAALGLLIWAASDGDVGNDLPGEMAPEKIAAPDVPPVVEAVIATRALPKETTPVLVAPGIKPGADGEIWTAAVETGGPSAEVLVSGKPRAELAAQLGLSSRRIILTVDEDRGSRLHIVGIPGNPWRTPVAHPLLSLEPVDTWTPQPFGPDVEGRMVRYTIPGVNALFGGETGAGKSTAIANVWAPFALSPASGLYVIDGGEVDTAMLGSTGLAKAWTTDRPEAIKILQAVKRIVDDRQTLLAQAGLTKATKQWMDDNGLGHDLLLVDELPTFTQDKSAEAKAFSTVLREVLQRCRKTGVHVVLSAQSPSVDVIDSDSRSIISVRWAGRARDAELCAKILGSGTIARGIDPRSLDKRTPGLGWFSDLSRDVVMRPMELTVEDRTRIARRGVELRKGSARQGTDIEEARRIVDKVAAMIRADGVSRPEGRVMRTRDIAERLGMDQITLSGRLNLHGVSSRKVRRTDSPDDDNRMHYILSDFPAVRAG